MTQSQTASIRVDSTADFDGASFARGRAPHLRANRYHCNYLRYDTTQPFHHAGAWSAFDASSTDGLSSPAMPSARWSIFYAALLYAGDGEISTAG